MYNVSVKRKRRRGVEKQYFFKEAERKLDYADFNCHLWQNGDFAGHRHVDYYEIIFPIGDSFINFIDGRKYLTSRKEVLIAPKGTTHSIAAIAKSLAPHYNIAIKSERFEKFFRSKKHFFSPLEKGEPLCITVGESTFNVLAELLASIDNSSYDERFLLIIETVLHLISASLLLSTEKEEYAENTPAAYCRDAIMKIDSYLYISENISDIYRAYPISHTAFQTEFKRQTGKRPMDYLSEKKMEYAKNLLLTTSLSVLEIAGMLGYESECHFIRKFGKLFGKTPLKYRKEHQRGAQRMIEELKENS